ncbi:MAG: hypoxanthine phosphoribosyltransferase [Dehalococcoidia bacterium]|nr:MAG: hypoxanthine phosphoribosyltransferase [Dehalococcoidia bacterium]
MAVSKEKAYYKAVRRAAAIANSDTALKDALNAIVRGIARAMKAGVSLMLLDSARKKLIHSTSWGLSQSYIRKGVLDADKSLAEVVTGEPVIITDVSQDSRVQYPEMATKAGIASMLGIPVLIGNEVVGSVRVYTREHSEFSNQDVNFVTTMANLTAVALHTSELRQIKASQQDRDQVETKTATLQQARAVTFAHPSEEEFAHLLDFYQIEWVYEPQSFTLNWEGDRVTEMFTPDFYLPGLNLYVELTTLKQSLVTEKNRKLRRLRQLYPEVNITLLYKRDFERLLAKYGCGPLAQLRGHGVSQVLYSSAEIQKRARELAEQISKDYAERHPLMVGVLRGVFCFMADLIRQMTIPVDVDFMAISYYGGKDSSVVKIVKDLDLSVAGRDVMMVEDIVDTGMTLNYILNHLKAKGPSSLAVCTLLDKPVRRLADIHLNYVGFKVPDKFVVGYGLDYREEYRNLPFIGVLEPEETKTKSELPPVAA